MAALLNCVSTQLQAPPFLSQQKLSTHKSYSYSHRRQQQPAGAIRCLLGKIVSPVGKVVDGVVGGVVGGVTGAVEGATTGIVPVSQPDQVKRSDFPAKFMFGASTSALQTEGSGTEGGRGPSTWDMFTKEKDGSVGYATDSYNKYKEDVQCLKKMGMDAYRMSISWSRLLPNGKLSGGINQEGIDFYNKFFKELLDNGIVPFVTLFHFDLPTALQKEYKGFLSKNIVNDFKDFADLCFEKFGDKVKHWTTINEPQTYGTFGYSAGLSPRGDVVNDPWDAAHNIILCHAAAAQLYKQKYQAKQGGEIGISVVSSWHVPLTDSPQDKEAADRANAFLIGWFMDPLVYGDYPFIMRALVKDNLPTFTDEEKEMVKGSYDFIGANYYTSRYSKDIPLTPNYVYDSFAKYQHGEDLKVKDGVPIGPLHLGASGDFYAYPKGLTAALIYLKERYQNPKIYITENGTPEKRDDTLPLETALQDDHRIEVLTSHLYAVREAIKSGVDMNGYFVWALMDCIEMGSYYDARFGLYFTDYANNLKRIPKKSANWFAEFLGKNKKK
ncbi:Glycoside hydrolase [Macleaya cordata]|uniref:Glycoside hydrolase n=1 Tax=Macleaya cordata TaxID=56857 RepID=A0A200R4D8_MACCD|nr:Glycoside hydrolase [Macleaya cordata]